MSFAGFFKGIAKGFVYTGKGLEKSGLWISAHPEVVAIVTSTVKLPPGVVQGIDTSVQVVGAIEAGQK